MMYRFLSLLLVLLATCLAAGAQQPADTTTPVQIINARSLYWKRIAPMQRAAEPDGWKFIAYFVPNRQ